MSVQLPDILSFCNVFNLRANKHCRAVSRASEKWLIDSGILLPSGMEWSKAKVGLLAAACYPNTDVTQLRLITDFLSLLFYCDERAAASAECAEEREDMFALLSDRLPRIAYKNPGWYIRFHKSQRSYLEARRQFSKNVGSDAVPDLESYIELRREMSGFRMAFDMIEYAGDLSFPESLFGDAVFRKLVEHACDIAAWSEDIVSCAKGISPSQTPNLVTVLMRERSASLDSALVFAGTLIKQSVDAFLEAEHELLSSSDLGTDREVQRYVLGLRDWIAGSVNWLYETQRFLGEKGSEVRTFGWVFVPVAQ
ncbi:hypothetical protein HYDPIDRAFT_102325 [Hydnomerulius pinastri MD-312]|uniref:Terpene synthase n=1 Tax=Hydnomerulius pinastri MD-312 TaxID=994086 RepID=A0A0C9VYY2_9AGAM|nr:hypothetical protein HYDPIDRAFT_102325 [Hydnomerulius pinastri MD-312]